MWKKLAEVDGETILLFVGMILYTCVLIFVEWRFNNDSQVFQVLAGVLTGFVGAFFGRISPNKNKSKDTSTDTHSST